MQVSRDIEVNATPAAVWAYITNIKEASSWISGIKDIKVLEEAKGPSIVGLKWQETREFMGKDATEVMWITDATEPKFYQTRAESHGSIYVSRMEVEEQGSGSRLTMSFDGQPVTFTAKLLWALTGWMAKKALYKTIDQDLQDIKKAAEG